MDLISFFSILILRLFLIKAAENNAQKIIGTQFLLHFKIFGLKNFQKSSTLQK
jgi:hypothetical protein